jgi:hypothetical protein
MSALRHFDPKLDSPVTARPGHDLPFCFAPIPVVAYTGPFPGNDICRLC